MEQVVVPAGESEYALAMLFSLNLSNPISYIRQDHGLGDILDMIPGSEVCFCYDFDYDDVIFRISRRWSAFRAPYSDDEKRIIEAGGIPPERSGYGLSIPAGDYSLLQTVPVDDEKELRSVAMTIAGRYRCGTMYVRMLKENPLECVMQIFVPGRLPQDLD